MKIRSRKEIRAFVGQKKDIGVTIFFPGKKNEEDRFWYFSKQLCASRKTF